MKTRIIEPNPEPPKRYITKVGDFFTYNNESKVLFRIHQWKQDEGWSFQHVDLSDQTIRSFASIKSIIFQKLKLVGVDGDGTMIFERETQ